MACVFNVNNEREIRKLANSKRFQKYPTMFLSNTCQVTVNADDYFIKDQFTIYSKYKVLPRRLCLYGKKTRYFEENNIYLNYWLDIFLKTVETGNLYMYNLNKSNSKAELCVGLPLYYRSKAYKGSNWSRKSIIEFLSCLFDTELEETNYEQQDFFENLLVA